MPKEDSAGVTARDTNDASRRSAATKKVVDALAASGIDARIIVVDTSARTAKDAAVALGVDVAQIAKSLVFRGVASGQSILVITAGDNRVAESKVAALVGEGVARANAKFVREVTGYAIGGVPPLAHDCPGVVMADATLSRFAVVWASAGTPDSVFAIGPDDLYRVAGACVADVRDDEALDTAAARSS